MSYCPPFHLCGNFKWRDFLLWTSYLFKRETVGQRGQGILFSVVLTPFSPQPPRQCGFYTWHLSTLNWPCITDAGLSIHMMGEVSWDPKRRRSWVSYYSILSAVWEAARKSVPGQWERESGRGGVRGKVVWSSWVSRRGWATVVEKNTTAEN